MDDRPPLVSHPERRTVRRGDLPANAVESAQHAIREWINRQHQTLAPDASIDVQIRAELQTLCREARRQRVSPESLLVVVKSILDAFEELQVPIGPRGTSAFANTIREDLIALCIDAYYEQSANGADDQGAELYHEQRRTDAR